MSLFKKKAKVMTECNYPKCEECEHYIANKFCDVPVIVTKQKYKMLTDELQSLKKKVAELEDEVYTK